LTGNPLCTFPSDLSFTVNKRFELNNPIEGKLTDNVFTPDGRSDHLRKLFLNFDHRDFR